MPRHSQLGTVVSLFSNQIQGQRSTLDALEGDNDTLDASVLTYPLNIDKQSGHFIMFHAVEPTPGSGQVEGVGPQDLAPIPTAETNLTPIANEFIQVIRDRGLKRLIGTRDSLRGVQASSDELTRIRQKELRTRTAATIIIYMPEKVTTGYGFDYQGEKLQIAGAGLQAVQSLVGLSNDAITALRSGGLGAGISALGEGFESELFKGLAEQVGIAMSAKLIDQLGSAVGLDIGAAGILQKNLGKIANPHMQFLFRSVNQRSFEYTFNFAAVDQKESEVIDNIIRTFKFYSHPEVVDSGTFLRHPAEFDIQYVSRELKPEGEHAPAGGDYHFQENDWVNKVGRCYLSSMSVDYSGAGIYSTHSFHTSNVPETLIKGGTVTNRAGNPPSFVTVTLTFNELETLTRQHIREGF